MTNSNTVNTVELNATKSVEIDAASGSGGFVVAAAQASITPAPLPDDKSVAAAELIEMLEKANTFFKDEQAKIISRDEASARFAAYMVKIGAKYHHDAEFRLALDTECVERRIPLAPAPGSTEYNDAVKNGRAPMNAFLPVVKLVDGEWGSRMDRRGKPVTDASGNIETMWYHIEAWRNTLPSLNAASATT